MNSVIARKHGCGSIRHGVAILLLVLACGSASADVVSAIVPAGTHIRLHVLRALSSDASKTGESFAFALLDPIALDARVVAKAGALGTGTVILAGHAGTAGHEGDLTLRLDSVATVDAGRLTFADHQFQINGRNRKVMTGLLGFVPFAGLGARFIRGSEIRVDPDTPISTVLIRPATILTAPSPVPAATPAT